MPAPLIAAAVPSIIGAGSSLLAKHSADKQAKKAYDAEQEQAHKRYNMQTYRFQQALKKYDMKRNLVKDFIGQHGLTPGSSVMDFLNAPDPTAPAFEDIAGTSFQGGPPTDYAKLGGSAAAAAAKLLAPKAQAAPMIHDTGDFSGPASGGVGPVPPEPSAPALNIGTIEKNAALTDEEKR